MQLFFNRVNNLFWLWTILGCIWAWFFPAHFIWFIRDTVPGTEIKLINLGLGVIMLGMGMTLGVEDFKAVLRRPWMLGLGVGAQFLIMPMLGWSVAVLFDLPPMLKLGVILVSCCPGGTASNVICYLARANVALSVLMTMASTLLAIGLTPWLTKVYASAILDVDAWAMFRSMVTIVLLPVLGGILLNQVFGRRLDALRRVSPLVSILVIVMIVGGVVGATQSYILQYAGSLLVAIFILHALGFFLGYGVGRLVRLKERECRTLSVEVGMQNSGLGSALAKQHFSLLAASPCAISALYHCLIGSFLAAIWSRQSKDGKQNEPAGGSADSL
ncbi:bile acid:sodium symporter family protein [Verrucomicrobiaceae bacterium N1E253]|uniref:Bile acid:sodium symporter family protein n=1 Tax=Oceaniferula marina TaxID=2748318 RepID=A0A851GQ60_9BACT|nr:bile acid:sodium symporter family protein [Oceaniferula marina]NWK56960.1 bile acid:sodium symporter family protein [Oceaniferula marina]